MWYSRVSTDLSLLPDFISYYDNELLAAKKECAITGKVEVLLSQLPGITEHRFNQLQDVEAVLNFLNIQLRKLRKEHFQKYLEGYARALTSRDAEKYTDGTADVIDFEVIINDVAFVRNRFLGIIKAFESKNYMLGHLSKLKSAGFEDFTL